MKARLNRDELLAFFLRVRVMPDGCWQWIGRIGPGGFGDFYECPRTRNRLPVKRPAAHRTAYQWFRGGLRRWPDWKLVNDRCGRNGCVNPAHWQQVKTHFADPLERPRTGDLAWFFGQLRVEAGCWLWQGPIGHGGYGMAVCADGENRGAHRVAYQWFGGPLKPYPEETLDHLCRVRNCVNPAHMEVMSPRRNVERMHMNKLERATSEQTLTNEGLI